MIIMVNNKSRSLFYNNLRLAASKMNIILIPHKIIPYITKP